MKVVRDCVLFALSAWTVGVSVAQDAPRAETKMQIDPIAIYDVRVGHIGTPTNDRKPQFQLVTRLTGGNMDDVTRLGFPIIEEFVDDTGKQLVDRGKFKGRETETNPYRKPSTTISSLYIDLPFHVDEVPARDATKIARVKGYVLVVVGGEPEPVFVPHAKRFMGGNLVHPRLDELNIRIRLLPPEEAGLEDSLGSFALAFESGQNRIRNVAVYDDWLRNTMAQTQSRGGDVPHTIFALEGLQFTEDFELGVYVFPDARIEKVEFDFSDIPLP